MDQAEPADVGKNMRLRRTWNALICVLESFDPSPIEDVCGRLERLEREVAALKNTQR